MRKPKLNLVNLLPRRLAGRRAFWAVLVPALALGTVSCEKEPLETAPAASADDAVLQSILNMGFARKDVRDMGTYYLVEGDIVFDKRKPTASAPPAQPGTVVRQQDQASTNRLVSYSNLPAIAIKIDPSFPAAWRPDVAQAVRDWNSIAGSRVNFYLTDGTFANITVRAAALEASTYGTGQYPAGGNPGYEVVLNQNNSPDYRRRTTIVHEIGHCLGFRHTNLFVNGEGVGTVGGNVVPGTPTEDPNSVMNSGDAPNRQLPWQGFSPYDVIGLQNLYPEDNAAERVFDPDYYLRTNADLLGAYGYNLSAATQHWNSSGLNEPRGASLVFDRAFYRAANPDLSSLSNRDLVAHWLASGANEGRASSTFFNARYYLANNPDLAAAYGSAGYQKVIDHFLTSGIAEGRVASPNFNVRNYLARYPDLARVYGTDYRGAMIHWITNGRAEGRNPR